MHRWLSDLLVARVSFWKAASAPGVTGEWSSTPGEAKEKVVTGRRAPGAETVLFRLRKSSLLFLSHLFYDLLFFFFFPGTGPDSPDSAGSPNMSYVIPAWSKNSQFFASFAPVNMQNTKKILVQQCVFEVQASTNFLDFLSFGEAPIQRNATQRKTCGAYIQKANKLAVIYF